MNICHTINCVQLWNTTRCLNTRLEGRAVFLLALVITGAIVFIMTKSYSVNQDPLSLHIKQVLQPLVPLEELTNITFVGRGQDDPALVAYIRKHELFPPSDLPYNLTQPDRKDFSQYRQSTYAEENFLHGMRGGFFLEAGALDGEDKSNSLYFEKYKGWTGLLVEPTPSLFRHLSTLHRKAYSINAAFSLSNVSATATFVEARGLGRIREGTKHGFTIRTFPFYSMLLALGVTQIDFFTLDIEGHEQIVLDTIPWDKVKFRLVCMEINKFPGGHDAYVSYFKERGYTFLGVKDIDAWFGWKPLLQETMDVDAWLQKQKL